MSDFHSLCRLCLTNNAGNINIFENKISPNIVTTIYATLNIKVSANDSLPKVICHSCTTNVERWYKYSKSCCDNQTKLANMARKQNGSNSIYTNWREEIFATLKSNHVEDDDYEQYDDDNELHDDDDDIYAKPAVKFQNGLTIIALPQVRKETKDVVPKKCRICQKQFDDLKSALSHEKYAHTRAEILTIDLTDKKELQEYNNDVVRNILKTKICSFCQRKIPKTHNMLFHLRSVHMKIPSSYCHYCNIKLPPVEYKSHIKNCPVRNADFSAKEETTTTISPPEPTTCKKMLYKCRKCDEKYPYKKAFYVHIQENHILPNNATNCPIECEHCLRNFLYHADYRAHFSIDSCLLQLVCENCNQFFETMRLFRVHSCEEIEIPEEETVDKSDYKFSCTECGSLFKTLDQWTDHRANHLSYNCTICKTKFFDYLHLKEHLKVHSSNCVSGKPKVTKVVAEEYDDSSTPQRSEDEDDNYVSKNFDREKDEDYEDERMTESPNYEPFDKAAYLEKYPNARECNICHKFLSGNASLYKHKRIHKRAARLEQEMYESLDDNQMAALKSIQLPGLTVTSTSINQRLKTEECCVCKNFFSTKDSLRHHLRTQHKDFYYSNKLFQSNMFNRPNLESLLKKNISFNPYNSKSTTAHSSSRDDYDNDRLRRSLKLKYQHKNVVLNKNLFSKFANRKFDLQMKKGGNFHKCELCGKKYVKKRSIVYHKINFHKMSEVEAITGSPKATKTYTCQECNKVFYTLPSLNGHLSWHDQMKKNADNPKNSSNGIDCALCGTHHHNITELRQHILTAHKSQTETMEKSCVCKQCKMVFKDDDKLAEHMDQFHKDDSDPPPPPTTPSITPKITVTDIKKLVNPTCSICKITFETKSALQDHALKCHTHSSKSNRSKD